MAACQPCCTNPLGHSLVLGPALTGPLDITNTAIIAAPGEARPENNVAEAILHVILALASLMLPALRAMQVRSAAVER
jgi:hypothetical protein